MVVFRSLLSAISDDGSLRKPCRCLRAHGWIQSPVARVNDRAESTPLHLGRGPVYATPPRFNSEFHSISRLETSDLSQMSQVLVGANG